MDAGLNGAAVGAGFPRRGRPRPAARFGVLGIAAVAAVCLVAALLVPSSRAQAATFALQVSTASDRSAAIPLQGATLRGAAYVFLPATQGDGTKVTFYLDDPTRSRTPFRTETWAPLDLNGTASAGTAVAWQTSTVADGAHTLSIDVTTSAGVTKVDTGFTVRNTTTPTPTPTPTPSPTSTAMPSGYTYTTIAGIPVGTTEAQSVVVHDVLYLFGGFDFTKSTTTPTSRAYTYTPASNAWAALPAMPGHGISHAGIDSDGQRYIYYAGGYAADAAGTGQVFATDAAYRYDTVTRTYSALPSLPAARGAGGMAYVNGRLYYFGGSNAARNQDSSDVWMLDVAAGSTTWVSRAPMPTPRNHLGWGVIGGKIYAVGGQLLNYSSRGQVELDRYDPVANTWTVLAPLPASRSHIMDTTFVIGGRLYVTSGWTSSGVTAAVTVYDPATNRWTASTNLPEARTSATAKSFSGGRFVYCCGSSGSTNTTGWLARPVS